MKICNADENNLIKNNTVVTIGNFDGLHKGHMKLMKKVDSLKKKYKLESVVLTFDVNTKLCSNLIYGKKELEKNLSEIGMDYLYYLNFIDKVKDMSCEEFVCTYFLGILKAKYVVVGEDFFFGKGKSGDTHTLKRLGEKYGFKTVVIPFCRYKGEILSSTYIRNLIHTGRIGYANKLMYKPFSISGTVKKGYHIGSSVLNVPTANTSIPSGTVMPKKGVYATEIIIDNKIYKGVTNVGNAPINPKKNPLCETFILDFNENIYRKKIKIIFIKYMRAEKQFGSFEKLKKQIIYDIDYRKGL